MICSCLIPSRGRINRLFAAIHTIRESASDASTFEILIRLDDDDQSSLKFLPTLQSFSNVRVVIGPRHQGYLSLETIFYTELAMIAQGAWCWFLLDDVILGGRDWDLKLAQVPTDGFIVQPEIFRLCGSTYLNSEGGNFPCAPTNSWLRFGWKRVERPVDLELDRLLRVQNGWKTHFLPGITAWHLEDDHDKLAQHRQ